MYKTTTPGDISQIKLIKSEKIDGTPIEDLEPEDTLHLDKSKRKKCSAGHINIFQSTHKQNDWELYCSNKKCQRLIPLMEQITKC